MLVRRFVQVQLRISTVLLALFVQACVSIPATKAPMPFDRSTATTANAPTVDFNSTFTTLQGANVFAGTYFEQEIAKVLGDSGMFSAIVKGQGTQDFHFDFTMDNHASVAGAMLSGFLSGLTMTVIPAVAVDRYTMTVDVERDGQLVKRYTYEGKITTYIQLFLVFAGTSKSANKAVKTETDNLLLRFLADLRRDGLLASAG